MQGKGTEYGDHDANIARGREEKVQCCMDVYQNLTFSFLFNPSQFGVLFNNLTPLPYHFLHQSTLVNNLSTHWLRMVLILCRDIYYWAKWWVTAKKQPCQCKYLASYLPKLYAQDAGTLVIKHGPNLLLILGSGKEDVRKLVTVLDVRVLYIIICLHYHTLKKCRWKKKLACIENTLRKFWHVPTYPEKISMTWYRCCTVSQIPSMEGIIIRAP